MGEDGAKAAQMELAKARDALTDARVLIDGDGTDTGILNRLYYAVFHAAQAGLYSLGYEPTSHGQVRQQFGQHIVLQGHVSREMGRLLGRLYDYRWEADYGAGHPDVDVDSISGDVQRFVDRTDELLTADESDG